MFKRLANYFVQTISPQLRRYLNGETFSELSFHLISYMSINSIEVRNHIE